MRILPVKFMEAKETLTLNGESVMFIPLVTIELQATTLRFALCDVDIPFAGNVYSAFPVSIGIIKNSVDGKRDNVDITISDVNDAFKVYVLAGGDFRGRTLEIGHTLYPDCLTDASQYDVVFRGQMDEPSLDDGKSEFSIAVKDPMSNYTCGRTLMLSCNAVFGDPEDCGATKNTANGNVQPGSTPTNIVIQSTHPVNHWKHGIITIAGQSINIVSSTGTQVITEYPFAIPSGSYALQSGCSKSFAFCGTRYNNQRNFGGCPGIPWEAEINT